MASLSELLSCYPCFNSQAFDHNLMHILWPIYHHLFIVSVSVKVKKFSLPKKR